MDTRTLVLGDWSRVVRDPLDLVRAGLAASAVAYAVQGDAGAAGYLTVSTLAVLGARLLNLPRVLDLAFVLAMTITGFGEALGFYDRWPWFDRMVHFTVPLLGSPVIYVALARAELVPDPRDDFGLRRELGLFVITLALGLAIGALWEILEWASDAGFGSNLSENNDDTVGDLIADGLGAAVGAGLLVLWTLKGWGSVRRIPGENRFEDTDA